MKRVVFGILSFAAGAAMIASPSLGQPPGGAGKEGKEGKEGKGGPPRFELGQIFPPPLEMELNLTSEQAKELEKIKKELKTKLEKLLTGDQKKMVENFHPRGPGGPGGPFEKGGPGEKGGDKGNGGPDRPAFDKKDKVPTH